MLGIATLVLSLFVLVPGSLGQETSSPSTSPAPTSLRASLVVHDSMVLLETPMTYVHRGFGDHHHSVHWTYVTHVDHGSMWVHYHQPYGLALGEIASPYRICHMDPAQGEAEQEVRQRFTTQHDLRNGWPTLNAVPVDVQSLGEGLIAVTWELPEEQPCSPPKILLRANNVIPSTLSRPPSPTPSANATESSEVD